jgi:hypothetical protein
MTDERLSAPRNMAWSPRPGWATVRLIGTCADRTLRRGQIVLHAAGESYDIPGRDDGLEPGAMVIILSEAARLVEDDLHLVPDGAIVAVGEVLP